jgi:hypothetical protein
MLDGGKKDLMTGRPRQREAEAAPADRIIVGFPRLCCAVGIRPPARLEPGLRQKRARRSCDSPRLPPPAAVNADGPDLPSGWPSVPRSSIPAGQHRAHSQ